MPVSSYYQAQPDGYVRFDWRGNSIEGEFFSYEECGRDIDPKWGYIRPFDRVIRQQLIDNLQATHGVDLQTFTSQGDLITCDAFATHKNLQESHQLIIESFDFVDESELTTHKQIIGSCRVDLLRRQYIVGSNLKEPKESLDSLNAEFLRWVTPFYTPLRYERKWFTKHRRRLLRIGWLVAVTVVAYLYYIGQ
ncbi:hypothetical protein KKZ54_23925 [Enterobacter hormaechei subsp. hoffmannii]|uniref:hypothetical protein n=1 Tax=Enterobacterales TaxID=91347 RepID=UPI0005DDC39C|nr:MULTISPECIES: hypothetical protein [Enterobacterales]EFN8044078.1 hypothetical protein [Escherichia coli]MBT1927063.1 hypothetical protein [Enterobacter hormaechei subsp. hoffmannii]CNI17743.1 Uncharacterised protein [Yersinia frederiksenii]HDT0387181.1 hypothetical protein [Klebsiella aerogenes]MBT1931849.1 hypothetical protein [Enterobacter hormaechei subsp. hoffmannii]